MPRDRDTEVSLGQAEPALEPVLRAVDERISITRTETNEAWSRLRILRSVLSERFDGTVYINGSIVHGDALTPLSDIDLGIIVGNPVASQARRQSPAIIMNEVCRAIENGARELYPGITAGFEGQKRAVVVRFGNDALRRGEDFWADVIVALTYPGGRGVLVPNLDVGGWDRSDPVMHSQIIRSANIATNFTFNRVIRLAKQWNRANGRPLSSWNIKALALSCLSGPSSLARGLNDLLHYALEALTFSSTPDPAGVGAPIGLEMPRHEVLAFLRKACADFGDIVASTGSDRPERARVLIESFFFSPLGENQRRSIGN